MLRRKFVFLGSCFSLGAVAVSSVCFAEPTSGWRAIGPSERTFSARTVDGRIFTFGVRDCVRTNNANETGVVLSVYRPDRSVVRTCIAATDLPEFSDTALLGYKTLHLKGWGDFVGWIQSVADWARQAGRVINRIVSAIRNVSEATLRLIKAILTAFDEFSGRVATELEALAGAAAAGDYALKVRDSTMLAGTLADRVFRALQATATTPQRVQAIANAIVAQPR